MTYHFDRHGRLVIIPVFVGGPTGGRTFQFAVDTAATRTGVSGLILERLGYQASQATGRHQVRTGSGGARAGLIRVARLAAFGQTRADHPVLWQQLPPAARIDGLLGLDFFRGLVLTLDFARGQISLRPPRRWWQFWR
jgi:predicted aspartyl protease